MVDIRGVPCWLNDDHHIQDRLEVVKLWVSKINSDQS